MSYESELANKSYIPNIVILFKGHYWAIRQPDSGLVVDTNRLCVDQVLINQTGVDPMKASTTINTYSFKLIDKEFAVTLLFNGITKFFVDELVKIWVGRCGVNMPFSDYQPLSDTYVDSVSRDLSAYTFKSTETKDRLNRAAFNGVNKLEVDILAATTEIDAGVLIDPLVFPAAGLFKLNDEFISYTSIDLTFNRFSGCVRGEKNTVPSEHEAGSDIFNVTEVTANPVDILLQCLVSIGGGGSYDVLPDGAGIDQALIDFDSFEEIRDEFFLGQSYNLLLYGIDKLQTYLEEEILYPNEIRIISNNTSKVALALLNRRIFDIDYPSIDGDTILKQPSYDANGYDVANIVNVEYDYSEATGKYQKLITLQDDDSIADFGRKDPMSIKLKGVKESLEGSSIATNIAQRFLARFAYPRPEISFSTQMDKSMVQLGDKVALSSNQLPNVDTGELNFADTVEVIQRGINWKSGDVRFKVAFTSFTGIKECFLAPSDSIQSFTTQKSLTVGAGRGSLYRPGWNLRLYSNVTREYSSVQVNEIDTIVGDVITFVDDWSTTLSTDLRIMFCDYDEATEQQRRYCFVSDDGLNFGDGKKSYQITL